MKETNYIISGDLVIPRVTHILNAMGIVDTSWYTEESANRGTDIHLLTMFIDDDLINSNEVDEGLRGYLKAYEKFKKENKTKVIESETEVIYRNIYGGHIDRVMEINGNKYIIDIKTGQFVNWHGIQLAAYGLAYDPELNRAILQLRANGRYTFKTSYKGESLSNDFWIDSWVNILKRYYKETENKELKL